MLTECWEIDNLRFHIPETHGLVLISPPEFQQSGSGIITSGYHDGFDE